MEDVDTADGVSALDALQGGVVLELESLSERMHGVHPQVLDVVIHLDVLYRQLQGREAWLTTDMHTRRTSSPEEWGEGGREGLGGGDGEVGRRARECAAGR